MLFNPFTGYLHTLLIVHSAKFKVHVVHVMLLKYIFFYQKLMKYKKIKLYLFYLFCEVLGAAFKNNITTKQESHQEYYCFFVEQFYLDQ